MPPKPSYRVMALYGSLRGVGPIWPVYSDEGQTMTLSDSYRKLGYYLTNPRQDWSAGTETGVCLSIWTQEMRVALGRLQSATNGTSKGAEVDGVFKRLIHSPAISNSA
jgi:hypothetical protein